MHPTLTLKRTALGLASALAIGGAIAGTVLAQANTAQPSPDTALVAQAATTPTPVPPRLGPPRDEARKPGAQQPGAQQPGAQRPHIANQQTFINRLAAKLGKEPEVLRQAIIDTRKELIDEAVQEGRISPEVGERMKQHLGGAGQRPIAGARGQIAIHGAAAQALGITPQELRQHLAAGKNLNQVATELGKNPTDVRNAIVATLQARVDEAVKAGRLHPNIAAQIKAQIPQRVDRLMQGQKRPAAR